MVAVLKKGESAKAEIIIQSYTIMTNMVTMQLLLLHVKELHEEVRDCGSNTEKGGVRQS